MQDDAFVIAFPTEFARPHMGLLAANIRKILRLTGQQFTHVKRDGDIIAIHANDPVFASAAINRLFGLRRVAIARRSEADLESLVSTASKLGQSLLLKHERFLVAVEGAARGFVPKDAEMAITSKIISEGAAQGVSPGSPARHDKLISVHITAKHAYTCMFVDPGLGGMPNMSLGQKTICPIYDEISAVSCIESARQGYDVHIVAVYQKSTLNRLGRILGRVMQFMPHPETSIEFYRTALTSPARYEFLSRVAFLCNRLAGSYDTCKISLPFASQIHGVEFVDFACMSASKAGIVWHLPLEGRAEDVRHLGGRYLLGQFFGRIRILKGFDSATTPDISDMIKTRRLVTVRPGPNTVHDILDSLD